MLPENPINVQDDWKCVYCSSTYNMDYVSEALLNAEQALKNSDDKEDIIQHYERYCMEMKYYVRNNYKKGF